jgi:hypothetical protein
MVNSPHQWLTLRNGIIVIRAHPAKKHVVMRVRMRVCV